MKVLTVDQVRELDSITIQHEPITSVDLMERAATSCFDWIIEHFCAYNQAFIFCGSGNNGGDGLVISRKLAVAGWAVEVCYPEFGSHSSDFIANLKRLNGLNNIRLYPLPENAELPSVANSCLVIDALVGSGLARALEGPLLRWVNTLNKLPNPVVAIDIPSGLFADKPTPGVAAEADFTLSFEVPKRAFLIPENQQYVGEWVVLPIGLDQRRLSEIDSRWFVLEDEDIIPCLRTRNKFDHKGTYGHALLVTGSYGKAGAAILASQGALRAGAGLVTAHVPGRLHAILQTALPEVMVNTDSDQYHFTCLDPDGNYTAIGIGCGLGLDEETIAGLRALFGQVKMPMVIDADALNILALHSDILPTVPKHSILTPHLKEFERLFGTCENHFERLDRLQSASSNYQLVIVLKGAHTAIATPDGSLFFNTTGNPGMATAGSGDVLTGIITGLLAQRYSPVDAARVGVYLHGLAGDLAAEESGYEALIASDIIRCLGKAFNHFHTSELH